MASCLGSGTETLPLHPLANPPSKTRTALTSLLSTKMALELLFDPFYSSNCRSAELVLFYSK